MLYLTLYTVGNVPKGPIQALVDEYKKFLSRFTKIDHRVITSIDGILDRLPEGHLIVLDASGKSMSSDKFAACLNDFDLRGEKITIIIGGPFGIPDNIKAAADLLLSLSPMTTTHDLALVLFLEQLFRACTINNKTGYHK